MHTSACALGKATNCAVGRGREHSRSPACAQSNRVVPDAFRIAFIATFGGYRNYEPCMSVFVRDIVFSLLDRATIAVAFLVQWSSNDLKPQRHRKFHPTPKEYMNTPLTKFLR
jgi:hypothetical protein